MLTLFSWLGRAALPLVAAWAPSLTPRLAMVAAVVLAALVAIGGPAGYVWLTMRGEVKAAELARDLHWTQQLQKAKDDDDKKVEAARRAGEMELPTPDDRARRLQLCKQSPTCRKSPAR